MIDTIFAVSSGAPPSAIAVMRISGPQADAALQNLIGITVPAPRRATVRTLRCGDDVLDTAIVLRFPGPDSVSGEDVVELHLHGGRATIASVGAALSAMPGLRPAEAGEFTRRGFANGRIDLAQAEGLSDLLRAETEQQRRSAQNIADGGLSRTVEAFRIALLDASARVEANMDFADEDDVVPWPDRELTLRSIVAGVDAILASPPAERLHDGIRVAIAGPPNSGKSTLLNALSGREAAIVSPIAGTTRDLIEVPVRIDGVALIFIDTAGLRENPGDNIEAIGISRAQDRIDTSDLVLWLGDLDDAPIRAGVVPIHTKADLDLGPRDRRLAVSAVTNDGMAQLKDTILTEAKALLPPPDAIALNARQRACLASMREDCCHAAATGDLILVAEHLRCARASIDRLTGRSGVEDMLGALFGTFCIGK